MSTFAGSAGVPPAQKPSSPHLPTWQVVRRLIAFRPGLFLGHLTSQLMLNGAWLAQGLLIRYFFNALTSGAPAGLNVPTLVVLMFASEAGVVLGMLVRTLADAPFFVNTMTLLRHNMLRHILRRPGASALPDSPGEAISRFRGDVFEMPLFALWMNDLIGSIVFCTVSILIMARTNAAITLVAVLPFLVVGAIANSTTKRIEEYRRASRRASGIVSGFIGELFGAVQAVKVATAEQDVIRHFHTLNEDRRAIALKDRLFNEILGSIFRNAATLGTGIVLLLAARAMQQHTFTVGDFSFFVFALSGISETTAFIGLLVARYQQIGVSVERMHRLMQGSTPEALVEYTKIRLDGHLPEVKYATEPRFGLLETLEARGLSFTYPHSENRISDVDLTIPRGSFTVITGRNGSGKTTLLRVLLGLLPKDSGEVRWNGHLVENTDEFFVPPNCAYTSQVPRLFSDTLRDNILMGLNKDDKAVRRALMLAVLEDDLKNLEEGLDTKVGPKGVKLSGGQMQRTAAARMFVREPELLVFDDLSSALDVETEQLLWERVFARAGSTCLVVSHRKPALRRADQIIVMQDGRVVAAGALPDLLETCPEMQRLWHGEVVSDAPCPTPEPAEWRAACLPRSIGVPGGHDNWPPHVAPDRETLAEEEAQSGDADITHPGPGAMP